MCEPTAIDHEGRAGVELRWCNAEDDSEFVPTVFRFAAPNELVAQLDTVFRSWPHSLALSANIQDWIKLTGAITGFCNIHRDAHPDIIFPFHRTMEALSQIGMIGLTSGNCCINVMIQQEDLLTCSNEFSPVCALARRLRDHPQGEHQGEGEE